MSDAERLCITTRKLNLWYGAFRALIDVDLELRRGLISALIGPSGCGKTTLLRCFNRINERYEGVRTEGEIRILGRNIYDPDVSLVELRKAVGMVFQRPNPMPISVYENVVFGLRVHHSAGELEGPRRKRLRALTARFGLPAGVTRAEAPGGAARVDLDQVVESALTEVGLWKDLKDRLHVKATTLQLEQQQRLCIARLLPLKPQVILMDEPCSTLDVAGTRAIEELMFALRGRYTIVIVTHNMAQARRVSDECVFMLLGEIVEHGRTDDLFLKPQHLRTAEYIEGRYG